MISSMTGYGKSDSFFNQLPISIEIRSINNRFLDISTKIPSLLSPLEAQLKQQIKDKIARGTIFLSISIGNEEENLIPKSYHAKAVESFLEIAKNLQNTYDIDGQVRLDHILSLPHLITYENPNLCIEQLGVHLKKEIDIALDSLILMRKKEGEFLQHDIVKRIEHIETTLDEIAKLEPNRILEWKEKFNNRLKILLQGIEIDSTRLLHEASIIADKLDIHEEMTRFKSHNQLFLSSLQSDGPQGKRLGFILQEMAREANTLGTKCQCAKITTLTIQLKEQVESIREQVMNVE